VSDSGGAGLTLTIDLAALARNWRRLADHVAPAECAAAVKADAYGIGIEQAVPALWTAGCRTFFVALPEEGVDTRKAAPDAVIYVLGGFLADAAAAYADADLSAVLNHQQDLETWRRLGPGKPAALHVDTGMNRLGFPHAEAERVAGSPAIREAGLALLISHLACADTRAHPKNVEQLALFGRLRRSFPGLASSLANSAGIRLGADYHFDMVRPGIALYGGDCLADPAMETVVTAEARVLQVRDAAAGESVGYGATEILKRPSRLAILAAGYADGYLRAAGASDDRPGAAVVIAGHRAPLVGRVSMDLMAVDVTDTPAEVRPGDRAELFGPNMPIEEAAVAAGTISYELLTGLSRRAERRYVGGPSL